LLKKSKHKDLIWWILGNQSPCLVGILLYLLIKYFVTIYWQGFVSAVFHMVKERGRLSTFFIGLTKSASYSAEQKWFSYLIHFYYVLYLACNVHYHNFSPFKTFLSLLFYDIYIYFVSLLATWLKSHRLILQTHSRSHLNNHDLM